MGALLGVTFTNLAECRGDLSRAGEVWDLNSCDLGPGHARLLAQALLDPEVPSGSCCASDPNVIGVPLGSAVHVVVA